MLVMQRGGIALLGVGGRPRGVPGESSAAPRMHGASSRAARLCVGPLGAGGRPDGVPGWSLLEGDSSARCIAAGGGAPTAADPAAPAGALPGRARSAVPLAPAASRPRRRVDRFTALRVAPRSNSSVPPPCCAPPPPGAGVVPGAGAGGLLHLLRPVPALQQHLPQAQGGLRRGGGHEHRVAGGGAVPGPRLHNDNMQ